MSLQYSHHSPCHAQELVNEIKTLELEVLNLERYLLSRYREVFEHCLAASSKNKEEDKSKELSFHRPLSLSTCVYNKRGIDLLQDSPKISSGRFSLGEYLCFSPIDDASASACKLSEDMIRCMSSIYIKLSDNASLSSSLSFHDGPLEVVNFSVDDAKFKYVESMMQRFKSFTLRLENVDPKKMENEEKLAFWINVHNALAMHAFLAYGLHQNYTGSTRSIMKAAYNVGGSSVNVYEIQTSILGCRPLRQELTQRLQNLILQPRKFRDIQEKHPYAITESNPMLYFALCMGAYSDPALRVYSSKNIREELELARYEFLQANIFVHKETKILLPKLLRNYAKAASKDLPSLLHTVHDSMPEPQRKSIMRSISGNPKQFVQWLPRRSNFRYLFQRDLLED